MKARQYGDSYLVLKDVRLRCTMCSTDSGGAHTHLIDATPDNFSSDSSILMSSTVVLGKICLRMSECALANNCKLYSLCIAFGSVWDWHQACNVSAWESWTNMPTCSLAESEDVRSNFYIAWSFGVFADHMSRRPIEGF